MLYPALSDLLEQVNNRYLLVNIIAKRARDISENQNDDEIKPVSKAINEIAAGELPAIISKANRSRLKAQKS